MKFFVEKEIEEIPHILEKRRKVSLKKFSSLLEEPILICGVSSSIDLPGWGIEELADKLGINVKVRYSNEVQENFPADVVIALSASGETEETVAALKKARAKIKIAITGNRNSSITKYATHVIPMICGEYFSDSATKSVVEQAYIVKQLLSEKFGQYVPITDKEINQVKQNLKLEFSPGIVDVFRRTNRVVVIGQRGFAEEIETKFQEIARIQAEGISGPLIFYSTIEILNQGDIVLVIDPERMVGYESALAKASRSRDIFYLNQLKIKGEGFYKTIIRYAGLVKLIIEIGKAKNVDIDHPEILTRTTRGFRTPLFTKIKQVVVIGGGSGIPSLIRAFKKLG
ncbi:MAG: SIS domain-containing protein, partial [Patescibacteria group bacterium]